MPTDTLNWRSVLRSVVEARLWDATSPHSTLDDWLIMRRSANVPLRVMARELASLTGVQLSRETVRKWLHALETD